MKRWILRGLALFGVLLVLVILGAAGAAAWAVARWDQTSRFPDTPYPALAASADPEVIARGRELVYGPAHCAQCHAMTDRTKPEGALAGPLTGGLEFAMGPLGTLYAANRTPDPDTGIGRRTDAELARVIRTGVMPDGSLSIFMRFSAAQLSDEDVVAVLSFLRAQPPVRAAVPPGEIATFGKVLLTYAMVATPRVEAAPAHVPRGPEPSVARGRYLAGSVMLCTACHTEYDPTTFVPVGPTGGGGTCEQHGDALLCPPNLTAHPTGVLGRMDEDAFVGRMRQGRTNAESIMPWENFGQTDESDLRSVYRYLATLPAVDDARVGVTVVGG